MAKKKQNIQLKGFDDIDFSKSPDIEAAQSVIKNTKKEAKTVKDETAEPKVLPKKKRNVLPALGKKRTSFNIDEDLHKAIRDYCYFEEIDMVDYVFERLVRPDLIKKGYYPPKKRRK